MKQTTVGLELRLGDTDIDVVLEKVAHLTEIAGVDDLQIKKTQYNLELQIKLSFESPKVAQRRINQICKQLQMIPGCNLASRKTNLTEIYG